MAINNPAPLSQVLHQPITRLKNVSCSSETTLQPIPMESTCFHETEQLALLQNTLEEAECIVSQLHRAAQEITQWLSRSDALD